MNTKRLEPLTSASLKAQWGNVRKEMRSKGVTKTVEHVTKLIRNKKFSAASAHRLATHLFQTGESESAGKILRAAEQFGTPHPVIDFEYGKWLWSMNRRQRALRFTAERARFWHASFLYHLLSVFYKLLGDLEMSKRCLNAARHLAKAELKDEHATRKKLASLQALASAERPRVH